MVDALQTKTPLTWAERVSWRSGVHFHDEAGQCHLLNELGWEFVATMELLYPSSSRLTLCNVSYPNMSAVALCLSTS